MRRDVGILLLVLTGAAYGFVATRVTRAEDQEGVDYCQAEYARAGTAADSARIDSIAYYQSFRRWRHHLTCGNLRARNWNPP